MWWIIYKGHQNKGYQKLSLLEINITGKENFEKNVSAVVLNVLYIKKRIYIYIYILPILLRGITSKNDGDFFVWIIFTCLDKKQSWVTLEGVQK